VKLKLKKFGKEFCSESTGLSSKIMNESTPISMNYFTDAQFYIFFLFLRVKR